MRRSPCKYLRRLKNVELNVFLKTYYCLCDRVQERFNSLNIRTIHRAWKIVKDTDIIYIILKHYQKYDKDVINPLLEDIYHALLDKGIEKNNFIYHKFDDQIRKLLLDGDIKYLREKQFNRLLKKCWAILNNYPLICKNYDINAVIFNFILHLYRCLHTTNIDLVSICHNLDFLSGYLYVSEKTCIRRMNRSEYIRKIYNWKTIKYYLEIAISRGVYPQNITAERKVIIE